MQLTKLSLCVLFLSTAWTARGAASLDDVLIGYREVASALAKDDFADTAEKAAKLVLLAEDMARAGGELAVHYKKVATGARAMAASAKEIELRAKFSVLSEGAVGLVKNTPTLQPKWQLYKCPMVGGGAFQFWLQPIADQMANPYMGLVMLKCGVRRA